MKRDLRTAAALRRATWWWAQLVWTPLRAGAIVWLTLAKIALIASGISRVLSRPLYATLAQLQRNRLPPAAVQGSAPTDR